MSRSRRPGSRSSGRGRSQTIRRGVLLGCFLAAGLAIVVRAVRLQVIEYERWAHAAEDQHRERVELPARRGTIVDRNGVPLALSHEMYQVSVAPRELRDREAAAERLAEGLGIRVSVAKAAVESERPWVVLAGRYTAEQRMAVGTLRGVYFERQFERFYPQGDVGREITGSVTRDGRALGGIEQQFDELLRGEPGYSILRREAGGDALPTISLPVVPPTDGASVHLTIDFDLQAIADVALREAIRGTGASGGDLLIGDPETGEILAAVSRRGGRTRSLTAITEPYEPGSTLKPFLAATLLAEGRASLEDRVYAERGTWQEGGRTFRDTSPHEWLTLREALEVSSNIALVKFAKRLSPGQQYAYLRDFGLGTLTGIEYPAESSGLLRRPAQWSRLSSASLAMGYEISVTPLQMLAAYGALANGGVLMEPYLVREVRGPDGKVLVRRNPTVVRRVVPEEVARAVTEVLVDVVEKGTATRAALATFDVAGKTGTSRRTVGGTYVQGAYTSTFAGYFPADDPQIVIFVKLDEPRGEYYGGLTAAPVTRETLQGILAAHTGTINGRTLLTSRDEPIRPVAVSVPVAFPEVRREGTFVIRLGDDPPPADTLTTFVIVPDLEGLSLREAASRAHEAGLAVRVRGTGAIRGTTPEAGSRVRRGDEIVLIGAGL